MKIITDERFREREKGPNGNEYGMFQKRWNDFDYHEDGGESINMLQKRNIDALMDILNKNEELNIVIGTHGTALSSILNYFYPTFKCDAFLRIIDWMPYVIELDFEDHKSIRMIEHFCVKKDFKGKARADKKN